MKKAVLSPYDNANILEINPKNFEVRFNKDKYIRNFDNSLF